MFFAKRRWALRVIEKMRLSVKSPQATELVSMIVQGAKQHGQLNTHSDARLSDAELVLISASAMAGNESALDRLIADLGLTGREATELLTRAHHAARKLAVDNGFYEATNRSCDQPTNLGDGSGATEDDHRAWTIGVFRSHQAQIEVADEATKMAFAVILALHWKIFLAEQQGPAEFGRLSRDRQLDYYNKMLGLCQQYSAQGDREKLVPTEMLCAYLAAIVANDHEFETEAGKFLDTYARKGWALASL